MTGHLVGIDGAHRFPVLSLLLELSGEERIPHLVVLGLSNSVTQGSSKYRSPSPYSKNATVESLNHPFTLSGKGGAGSTTVEVFAQFGHETPECNVEIIGL